MWKRSVTCATLTLLTSFSNFQKTRKTKLTRGKFVFVAVINKTNEAINQTVSLLSRYLVQRRSFNAIRILLIFIRYIEMLLQYLISFCERVKPLLDLREEYEKVEKRFEEQWEASEFPGWGREAGSAMAHSGAHLDLSAFSSSEVTLLCAIRRPETKFCDCQQNVC